jgi:multidrug resistance efflux pump
MTGLDIFALFLLVFLFIPLQWGAPSGSVRVVRQSVAIVPNVAGQVIEVPVQPNMPLKKGDVLFRLDPRPFQYALDAKKAALAEAEQAVGQLKAGLEAAVAATAQARAQRDRARKTYDRYAEASQGSVPPFSEQEVETRRLTYLSNEAALGRALAAERQARLAAESEIDGVNTAVVRLRAEALRAEYDLEQTTVRAPADGFVTNVALREGARVAAFPIAAVMALIDTSETIVGAQVQQIYARHIEPGQKADMTFKSFPGKTLQATVVSVLEATAEGQVQASGSAVQAFSAAPGPFFVRLEIDDAEAATKLPVGLAGEVAIYTNEIKVDHVIRKVMIRMNAWMNYLVPA